MLIYYEDINDRLQSQVLARDFKGRFKTTQISNKVPEDTSRCMPHVLEAIQKVNKETTTVK